MLTPIDINGDENFVHPNLTISQPHHFLPIILTMFTIIGTVIVLTSGREEKSYHPPTMKNKIILSACAFTGVALSALYARYGNKIDRKIKTGFNRLFGINSGATSPNPPVKNEATPLSSDGSVAVKVEYQTIETSRELSAV